MSVEEKTRALLRAWDPLLDFSRVAIVGPREALEEQTARAATLGIRLQPSRLSHYRATRGKVKLPRDYAARSSVSRALSLAHEIQHLVCEREVGGSVAAGVRYAISATFRLAYEVHAIAASAILHARLYPGRTSSTLFRDFLREKVHGLQSAEYALPISDRLIDEIATEAATYAHSRALFLALKQRAEPSGGDAH